MGRVLKIVGIEKLPEGNTTQTYENEDYIITASYSEKAEIPENAEFIFSVISAETDFDRYAECYYGRSVYDAPEIDGKIFFMSDKKVGVGEYVNVLIDEPLDYDLIGTRV